MEVTKYEDSGIAPEILRAVTEMGFENMTPIQEQAIPILLTGKDVIGQAQTGTGKTAAFGIPLIQAIDVKNRALQAVVLCPTRELAIQAADEIRRFGKYTHGVRVLPIYGGQEIYKQIKALKGGVQVIVGTPGRVMDHMRRHTIKMDDVKMVVLDEADEMLNMGFREDMETILKDIPNEHQTALFSATMPKAILDITGTYQKEDAVLVKIVKEELTIPLVEQLYYQVRNQYKEEAVARILGYYNIHRCLIFCNTKKMVDELAQNLKKRDFSAEGLHGDLSQHQRDVVMNRFRGGNLEVLIATDVAARGIDVDDVEAVFNFDIPQDIEYYVHRIGRTGRAGKEGKAFTLVTGREMHKVREIERSCKTKLKEKNVPTASTVTSIKAKKVLAEACSVLDKTEDLEALKTILSQANEDGNYSELDLAAALLRMHLGEETSEIENFADVVNRTGDRNRTGRRDRNGSFGPRRDGGRPDGRRDGRSEGRRDGRTDGRSDTRRDGRTDGRSDTRRDGRTDGRSDTRRDSRPDSRPDTRREVRTDDKTTDTKKEGFKGYKKSYDHGSEKGFDRNKSKKPVAKKTTLTEFMSKEKNGVLAGQSGFRRERSSASNQ